MSSVIDLRAWKSAHAFSRCGSCGSKLFRIHDTGVVRCARCSAQVPNPGAQAAVKPSRWARIARALFSRRR